MAGRSAAKNRGARRNHVNGKRAATKLAARGKARLNGERVSQDTEARQVRALPERLRQKAAIQMQANEWKRSAQSGMVEFWQEKTVEELARQQGISIPQDLDRLIGSGSRLWKDDRELDAFLAGIYQRRRAARR